MWNCGVSCMGSSCGTYELTGWVMEGCLKGAEQSRYISTLISVYLRVRGVQSVQ